MLQQFDINCWEEPDVSVTLSFPPALINHLDVGDDIIRFEGDLVVSLCGAQKMERFDPEKHGGGEYQRMKQPFTSHVVVNRHGALATAQVLVFSVIWERNDKLIISLVKAWRSN